MEVSYIAGAADLLWSGANPPCYLVFGEEDVLKHEVERALIEKYSSPDFADFDLEILNADSVSAEAILAAASQSPFGSDRRVVVVRGLEQWRNRSLQAEADRLAAGISNLTSSACLVLIAAAEEDEARRKTAVSLKLDAAVKQVGALVSCRGLKGEQLVDWVREQFRSQGRRIDQDAAELLIASVGSEMRSLDLEIFKLIHYVDQDRQVTTHDISAVVATQSEDVMFLCVEAISRKQTDRALSLLHELHRHDSNPQAVAGRLLALLLRQFKLIWQAKHLALMGVPARDLRSLPPDIAAELPAETSILQVAFKAAALFSIAGRYSADELRLSMERLLLCDLANKGGVTQEDAQYSTDPGSNLQLLVLQLTSP